MFPVGMWFMHIVSDLLCPMPLSAALGSRCQGAAKNLFADPRSRGANRRHPKPYLLPQVNNAFFRGTGQPVLIGTCDINESEEVSRVLTAEGCVHAFVLGFRAAPSRQPPHADEALLAQPSRAPHCSCTARGWSCAAASNGHASYSLRGRLPHRVLNARPGQQERESQVIARAGLPGAITLATNMAGAPAPCQRKQAEFFRV